MIDDIPTPGAKLYPQALALILRCDLNQTCLVLLLHACNKYAGLSGLGLKGVCFRPANTKRESLYVQDRTGACKGVGEVACKKKKKKS